MPGHDAECGVGRALIDIEAPPNSHHHGEEKQRERDAQRGERTAPPITKGILRDKLSERHRRMNLRTVMEYRYLTLYWCVGPGIGSLHRCMVKLQDKLPKREMSGRTGCLSASIFMPCRRLQSLDTCMTTEKMLSFSVFVVRLSDVKVVQLGGEENY